MKFQENEVMRNVNNCGLIVFSSRMEYLQNQIVLCRPQDSFRDDKVEELYILKAVLALFN